MMRCPLTISERVKLYQRVLSHIGDHFINSRPDYIELLNRIEKNSMPEDIKTVLYTVLERAAQLNQRSSRSDGGAYREVRDVEMYVWGWCQVLPPAWEIIRREIENKKDPEYAEYQRLKEKFGE